MSTHAHTCVHLCMQMITICCCSQATSAFLGGKRKQYPSKKKHAGYMIKYYHCSNTKCDAKYYHLQKEGAPDTEGNKKTMFIFYLNHLLAEFKGAHNHDPIPTVKKVNVQKKW